MLKRQVLYLAVLLPLLAQGANAVERDREEYVTDLRMMNVMWNACRFLGYLDEEAPSHGLLIAQTEKDLSKLFTPDHERMKARDRAWTTVNDLGLALAEKVRSGADPETACKNGYSNLKAVLMVTRDRLGLK